MVLLLCTKCMYGLFCAYFFRMDSKGEGSRQSYPNIFFMVDTFDQVYVPLFYMCVKVYMMNI